MTVHLVGRDRERAELSGRLDDHRLVTIVGPGGIGKTALARAAAEEHGPSFEHGAHFVDLTRVDAPESVGRALAVQLGFPSLPALLAAPGDQPALIVVDNCEHVLDAAAAAIAALLESCASPTVLATSRSPLELPGESLVILGPLPSPARAAPDATSPAVVLFEERALHAGRRLTDADVDAVAELCRVLDGVPLALEIAAARSRTLSPAEILARLDDLSVLTRARYRGAERHRSLASTIDWSYRALGAEAQRVFERLGVLAGRFTAGTALALAPDASPGEADRALDELVDASLVAADHDGGSTTYRLLHPVRLFARERLAERGDEPAILDRYVRHVTDLAVDIARRARSGWDADVLGELLDRSDDVIGALRHCVARDDEPTRALLLLAVLWGAVHQGQAEDVAAVGEEVLARWPEPSAPGWADAMATVATCRHLGGDGRGALELAERALAVADRSVLAACTLPRLMGQACASAGDLDGAAVAFDQGIAAATDRGMAPFAQELSVYRALVQADAGDVAGALARVRQAGAAAMGDGSDINELWARATEAYILLRSDPAAAADVARAVISDPRTTRYPASGINGLRALAMACLLLGDERGAAQALVDLVDRVAERGAHGELRSVLLVVAVALGRAGSEATGDLATTAADTPGVSSFVTITQDLLSQPSATGRALSPSAALRRARSALGALLDDEGPRAATGPPEMARQGDAWRITYEGQTVHLRATKGLADLARLLAEPGREIHCLDLAGAGTDEASTGDVLDGTARRQLEDRIRDLQIEVDDARAAHDTGREEQAQAEMDAVVDHLVSALGLGGRVREGASTAERARSAVTRRLRAAVRRVGDDHPALGRHLEGSVRTGAFCSYRPEHEVRWAVRA